VSWPTPGPTPLVGRTCIVEAVMPERDLADRDGLGRRLHAGVSGEDAAFFGRLDKLVVGPEFVQVVAVSLRLRWHLPAIETIAAGHVRSARGRMFLLGLLLKHPERHQYWSTTVNNAAL
jgi:hypothetical protein